MTLGNFGSSVLNRAHKNVTTQVKHLCSSTIPPYNNSFILPVRKRIITQQLLTTIDILYTTAILPTHPKLRRHFHWVLFIFKCISFNCATYLKSLLIPFRTSYSLRNMQNPSYSVPSISKGSGCDTFESSIWLEISRSLIYLILSHISLQASQDKLFMSFTHSPQRVSYWNIWAMRVGWVRVSEVSVFCFNSIFYLYCALYGNVWMSYHVVPVPL